MLNPNRQILIVSPGDSRSGAGIFRHALACEAQKAGYRVTIAQPEENDPIQAKEAALGIEHHFFSRNPYHGVVAFAQDKDLAAAEINKSAPDLVIFSSGLSPLCHYSFLEIVTQAKIPYIMIEQQVARHMFTFAPQTGVRFAEFYSNAAAVVTVSRENLHVLRECLALPEGISSVILYGRPDGFFRPRDSAARTALRRKWGVPKGALVALTVAKLEPVKGHGFIIEALQRLKSDGDLDKFFFVWIGDGIERSQLESELNRVGIANHVRLLGHSFDVAPFYDGGDVFVLTSLSEGMPLVVMEAMAKGLPPICTDVGGTAEAIGDAGIVLPSPTSGTDTAGSLLLALRRLNDERPELKRLSARARQRASDLFREGRMIREYLDLIGNVLSRPKAESATTTGLPGGAAPRTFPTAHYARPLIFSFYGDGEALLGNKLLDFFNTVPIFGRKTELCRIMTECGSDKGSGWHNYTLLYDFLFGQRRREIERVFELGIGTNFQDMPSNMGAMGRPGASLRGWRNYFPAAKIVGADIDRRILFSDDRISTHYLDQLNPQTITAMWEQIEPGYIDVIIDDGLHTPEANACFMRNSIQKLRPGGYFIIEDIVLSQENLGRYHQFFSGAGYSGVMFRLPSAQNYYDNCLGIFTTSANG